LILNSCREENVIEREPRLDYYIESYEVDDLGFQPLLKVDYEYRESGELDKYTVLSYAPDKDAMVEQRYFVFSYANDRVGQLKGYLPDAATPYIEYSYQYVESNEVSKIAEVNHGTGINSEANFTYAEDGTVKVSYVFSNGGSFQYEFDFATGNILNDKTTRGAQLCSDGQYTYDQHPNPFKNLGYVDYLLTNICANNRLTENVNYVACAFPSLIPESYTYEYNDRGFPVSVTTAYKSAGSVKGSKREFFYQ
ncbi:MAG TPA: hypothetical protein VFO54_07880, partial [Chryseosolibacter sp.]|nr:hypothetical protein [Chryseosolibacter sp.]